MKTSSQHSKQRWISSPISKSQTRSMKTFQPIVIKSLAKRKKDCQGPLKLEALALEMTKTRTTQGSGHICLLRPVIRGSSEERMGEEGTGGGGGLPWAHRRESESKSLNFQRGMCHLSSEWQQQMCSLGGRGWGLWAKAAAEGETVGIEG